LRGDTASLDLLRLPGILRPVKTAFRLLPYFYLLLAALVLVSLVLVLKAAHQAPNPRELATLIVFLLIAVVLSTVYLLNAIFLLRRVKRRASIILSLISCLGFPFGTILGTLSLFVLTRNEIKNEYS
jgi:hypothetical protein